MNQKNAFFEHVQRQSVQAICRRCERAVRLMPAKTLLLACPHSKAVRPPR
jgi:hypothetical protein